MTAASGNASLRITSLQLYKKVTNGSRGKWYPKMVKYPTTINRLKTENLIMVF